MRIGGLQKLTLLDYPDKMACTVFTAGCNFRCPFCHNAGLIPAEGGTPLLRQEEVLAFLDRRRGLLDGVCVTGGEPLLQPDLEDFLREVKKRGYRIKLDTNGSLPDRLRRLTEQGLADYVAMDVKTAPEAYSEACGVPADRSALEESRKLLLEGRVAYEFRTTVVRGIHSREKLRRAAEWIQGAEKYCLQPFQKAEQVRQPGLEAFSPEEMQEFLQLVRPYVKQAELRGI